MKMDWEWTIHDDIDDDKGPAWTCAQITCDENSVKDDSDDSIDNVTEWK